MYNAFFNRATLNAKQHIYICQLTRFGLGRCKDDRQWTNLSENCGQMSGPDGQRSYNDAFGPSTTQNSLPFRNFQSRKSLYLCVVVPNFCVVDSMQSIVAQFVGKLRELQSLLKYFEFLWQSIRNIWKELEDSTASASGPAPGPHVLAWGVLSVLTDHRACEPP